MPGTLMLEAMSQTMTLAVTSMDEFSNEWEGLPTCKWNYQREI